MSDPLVAVVVSVPEEYFLDDDDICLAAGRFVCLRLQLHLIRHGHFIADWIRGGCEEDWGVYFESQHDTQTFGYAICFFAAAVGSVQCHMVIQYYLKVPFLKTLFRKPPPLSMDHDLHEIMQEF